jgi:hypothetical protein
MLIDHFKKPRRLSPIVSWWLLKSNGVKLKQSIQGDRIGPLIEKILLEFLQFLSLIHLSVASQIT